MAGNFRVTECRVYRKRLVRTADPTKDRSVTPAQESLWYKSAIIYQVHVKAFLDSTRDGYGDFRAAAGSKGDIALKLENDGTFTWIFTRDGKPREFAGKYTLQGNSLALEFDDGGGMVGNIEAKGNGFHFEILNGPEDDPGLDFVKG